MNMAQTAEEKVKELTRQLADATENLGWADSILGQIKEVLAAKGIPMNACPPMLYPEAVHNLYVWTAMASRDCWRDHQWHNNDVGVAGKCLSEGVKRYADKKA
jgi:hypothetical protein